MPQSASCSATPNGSITVNATGGTVNHTYSIDGVNFQSSNVFTVTNNDYTVTIKDQKWLYQGYSGNCSVEQRPVPCRREKIQTICKGASIVLTTSSNGYMAGHRLVHWTIHPLPAPQPHHQQNTAIYGWMRCSDNATKSTSIQITVKEAASVCAGSDVFLSFQVTFTQLFALQHQAPLWHFVDTCWRIKFTSILSPIANQTATTLYVITAKNAEVILQQTTMYWLL